MDAGVVLLALALWLALTAVMMLGAIALLRGGHS